MKKRVYAFCMALLMLLLAVSTMLCQPHVLKAAGGAVIKLHYNREDGDYSPWKVWFWEEGKDGADYPFVEEDGDMVATIEAAAGCSQVGFIIKTDDWTKDFDGDQFIDITEVVSGTVHVYVEAGQEGFTKEYADDCQIGTKLKTAKYNDDSTISITMTGEIEGDYKSVFTVEGQEGQINIDDVTDEGKGIYTATLEKPLDNKLSYTIGFDGTQYSVIMPIYYSTEAFEKEFTYEGDDLGATWTKDKTSFRVWAPTATELRVNLYESGDKSKLDSIQVIEMTQDVNGTWVAEQEGDLNGVYYTYSVKVNGSTKECCDPYARTTGVNGDRAMIINLDSTDPEGWDKDVNPHAEDTINDAIIYEAHIRDLTVAEDSGIENPGKYLGLTEVNTKTSKGIETGLSHIKDLGVTHVQILPMYDFGSVNETYKTTGLYNWGYDPVNYNVPEGSYSTDPYNGEVRVKEAKEMIKALHDNDISVVMDVVYNHVYSADNFCYNVLVPGYYTRVGEDGKVSNGSGCGNDVASERSMVKKYIVESVLYWTTEYHMDGFRFDLVGLLDTSLMNEIVEEVHAIRPDVIFYGEGWSMETIVTKEGYNLSTQTNSEKLPEFAFFNDTIRDSLKGGVFNTDEVGFVSGAINQETKITKSFLGAVDWCKSPSQSINYSSCHDNNTLYDRLKISVDDATEEELIKMNNLAAAVYLTAEGVPFMQAGEEMLRSKINEDGTYNSNSYCAGDEVNAIDWNSLEDEKYSSVYEYYKGLIAFRKSHGALRLSDSEDVAKYITAVEGLDSNMVAFDIQGGMKNERAQEIFVAFNANKDSKTINLPEGKWSVYINGEKAGTESLGKAQGQIDIDGVSALVLVKEGSQVSSGLVLGIIAAILGGIILVILISLIRYKKETK